MPYTVNGQTVHEELTQEEAKLLERDVFFQHISDERERAKQLRLGAEGAPIDKTLIARTAVKESVTCPNYEGQP
jgi:hypothetical protein